MKKTLLCMLILPALLLLNGFGGQEIESSLFVLSLAVDPAPDGNLTVTVKALSGTKEADAAAASPAGDEQMRAASALETPESGAAYDILSEIHAMYRANGEAVVVVTPDDAGDFIRRQKAILGVRLSQYLEVLFDHFRELDTIPPHAQLARIVRMMESGREDALAVYAAGNDFNSTLALPGTADTDRLPGHLPRTAPAENEYLGSAMFSGARMTGVLTGEETGLLCLMMGEAKRRVTFIGDAQYQTNLPTRVSRFIDKGTGALTIHIRMNLVHIAGEGDTPESDIAAQIESGCANVLRKLQAAGCDAAGFGHIAARRAIDLHDFESMDWQTQYETAPVAVSAGVKVL